MTPSSRKPPRRSSTAWIFAGLFLGILLGGFLPGDQHPVANAAFRFMSHAFINLIKGLIVPLLFSTIIVGIAQTGDLKAVGRMGGKALLYFEIVTTFALFIGLGLANWVKPGAGLYLDPGAHAGVALAHAKSGWDIALHLFPSNLALHAMEGDILPVVIFASLFGLALTQVGERGKPVLAFFDGVAQTMFKYTDMVMVLTPLGVFGSMAYNVSAMAGGAGTGFKGWPAVFHLLRQYGVLVGSLYLGLALLVLLVFVPVMLLCGIKVMSFFRAVKDPALMAYSTASSEAALPGLLEEMVLFGVPRRVASFVIPTGYSFNLDGSTLYLVLASMAIAQAAHIHLSFGQQVLMMFTFMLTSKGVAGVPRSVLVIIAGACASFGLPGEAGLALLLAVDELSDMPRTALNVIGNGLASVVVAKWEGVFGTEPAVEENDVKLVIWDFDGTLADTRPIIEAGMDHALQTLGLPAQVREEWLKYVGLPVEEGIRRTFTPLGLTVEQVLPAYRTFKHIEHEHLIKGFDGITELLAELHRRGIRQAIASSKRGEPLRRQVAALEWEAFFNPLVTPDEVKEAKPDPESILRILKTLGVDPAEAVMVGDTPFDLDMARRAGVRSVAVGHGFYGQEALAAFGPMAYAPDTAALADILLAWSAT